MTWEQLEDHEKYYKCITALVRVEIKDVRHDYSYVTKSLLRIYSQKLVWVDFLGDMERVGRDHKKGANVLIYVMNEKDCVVGSLIVLGISSESEVISVYDTPKESAREIIALNREVMEWRNCPAVRSRSRPL